MYTSQGREGSCSRLAWGDIHWPTVLVVCTYSSENRTVVSCSLTLHTNSCPGFLQPPPLPTPSRPTVFFSKAFVNWSQLQSEYLKWKIQEINWQILTCLPPAKYDRIPWFFSFLLSQPWVTCIQWIHTVYPACPLVNILVVKLTGLMSKWPLLY